MKGKRIVLSVYVLVILLAFSLGAGQAQGPGDRSEPQGEVSVAAVVSSKFSYQGVLRENGNLVTGSRNMVFHLFSDSACTLPISGDISRPGVSVKEGLFSVELAVHQNYIDGQGLWLEIRIGGTVVGCQEILPVPYALSLRPGASVTGQQTSWDAIHAVNTAPTGSSYGVYARSYSTGGRGLSAWASAASGTTYGVYAQSDSASGAGVYA